MQTFCGSPAYLSPEVLCFGGKKKRSRSSSSKEETRSLVDVQSKALLPSEMPHNAGDAHNAVIVEGPITAAMQSKGYDYKCDIWSAGVILYLLVSGQMPFSGLTPFLTMRQIKRGIVNFNIPGFERVSEGCKAFIQKLLTANPSKRPEARDCLQDSWLQEMAGSHATAKIRELLTFEKKKTTSSVANRLYHEKDTAPQSFHQNGPILQHSNPLLRRTDKNAIQRKGAGIVFLFPKEGVVAGSPQKGATLASPDENVYDICVPTSYRKHGSFRPREHNITTLLFST